jgi:hypothetical protein
MTAKKPAAREKGYVAADAAGRRIPAFAEMTN